MGITQYQRAVKMLKMLKQEKGEIISFEDFNFAMRIHISGDITRVQLPYFQMMKQTKLIEEQPDGTIKLL